MKTQQKGFTVVELLLIVVTVAALGGAGYYVYSQKKDSKASLTPNNSISLADQLPAPLEGLKTLEEIRSIATAQDSSPITEVELEQEHGSLLYKVKLSNGRVLFFDAKTGAQVTNVKDDDENDDEDEVIPADFKPGITLEQARQTAQDKRPGKVIVKVELENEHGVVVYNVRFSDDGRVEVNATDGAVVRVKEPKPASNSSSGSSNSGSSDNSDSSNNGSSNSGSGSSNSDLDDHDDDKNDEDEDDDDPDD